MANDGKITITISDDRGSGRSGSNGYGGGNRTGSGGGSKRTGGFGIDNPLNTKENSWILHEALHALKQETIKVINNAVGNIGIRTGNYVMQQNVQNAMGVAGELITIGGAAYIGFKKAGPYGALTGAALGAGIVTLNRGIMLRNYEMRMELNNREIRLLRERAGLSPISNGSR